MKTTPSIKELITYYADRKGLTVAETEEVAANIEDDILTAASQTVNLIADSLEESSVRYALESLKEEFPASVVITAKAVALKTEAESIRKIAKGLLDKTGKGK